MKKVMIVLGMIIVLAGSLMISCGKSKEEKTEQKTAEKKKIEKKVELGKPFTFWVFDERGEKKTQFSVTFERLSMEEQHPTRRHVEGGAGYFYARPRPYLAPENQKYMTIYVRVENLGPRSSGLIPEVEYKNIKGYIYRIGFKGSVFVPNGDIELVKSLEWEDNSKSSKEEIGYLEPGEQGWLVLYELIPEENVPTELFGILDSSEYFSKHREMLGVRFRLDLTSRKGMRSEGKKEIKPLTKEASKVDIPGKYISDEDSATIFLRKDGTVVDSLVGKYLELKSDGTFFFSGPFASNPLNPKWKTITIIRFNFPRYERHEGARLSQVEFFEGEIKSDTILMPEPQKTWLEQAPNEKDKPWVKQKTAKLIQQTEQADFIWSEYNHENVPFTLALKKGGICTLLTKGRWEIKNNIIVLYGPGGVGESVKAELKGDNIECPDLSEAPLFKQEKAQAIKKTEQGTFWSQYTSGDESIFLEFKRDNSFNLARNVSWLTRPGIIFSVGDLKWKAEIKDQTLIDEYDNTWVKSL